MPPNRQRLVVWSIPVAALVVFFALGWNQRHRGDAEEPEPPAAGAQAVLLDALEAARRIPYAVERDRVLLGVAAGLAQTGETAAALRVAATVTKAPLRAQAFFLVLHALEREGKIEEAGELLPRIHHPGLHTGAVALLVAARLQAGEPDAALRLYHAMPASGDRRRLWEYVAAHRPGPDGIAPVLRIIEELAGEERDWALAGIVRALASHGRVRPASELTERIASEQARVSALWGLAGGQARGGDLGGALLTASELPPQHEAKAAALAEIAKAYALSGDAEGAQNMADMLSDARERACVLRAVAVTQASSGDAESGFRTSLRIAEVGVRAGTQVDVVGGQAEGGEVAGALTLATGMQDEAIRARMMGEVAAAQAAAGALEGAMRTVSGLPEARGLKAALHGEAAAARARAGELEEAAAMADAFGRPAERAVVLLGAARGALERADKIDRPSREVVCGFPSPAVDLLLRPASVVRLVERAHVRS